MDIGSADENGYTYGINTILRTGSGTIGFGSKVKVVSESGASDNKGYYAEVTGASYNTGYRAYAGGGTGSWNYGFIGFASGGAFSAAGYFGGDVWANTYNTISDRKFKTDIQDYGNGLETVMALRPRTYMMKVDEYKDRVVLPKGKQIGFIAQELETVLPGLVKDAVEPPHGKEGEISGIGTAYKSVNYDGVIPVLVKAVQEQQAMIQILQAEIAVLKAR